MHHNKQFLFIFPLPVPQLLTRERQAEGRAESGRRGIREDNESRGGAGTEVVADLRGVDGAGADRGPVEGAIAEGEEFQGWV